MEEINKNDLMSRKHKNACTTLKYIEHNLGILSNSCCHTVYVSISAFESLIGVSIVIASSAAEFKIFGITVGIKNHKSIIEKKGKNI